MEVFEHRRSSSVGGQSLPDVTVHRRSRLEAVGGTRRWVVSAPAPPRSAITTQCQHLPVPRLSSPCPTLPCRCSAEGVRAGAPGDHGRGLRLDARDLRRAQEPLGSVPVHVLWPSLQPGAWRSRCSSNAPVGLLTMPPCWARRRVDAVPRWPRQDLETIERFGSEVERQSVPFGLLGQSFVALAFGSWFSEIGQMFKRIPFHGPKIGQGRKLKNGV